MSQDAKCITPSKSIWDYYNRSHWAPSLRSGGITVDLIMTSIADVLGGYHISYSATELLIDLEYLRVNNGKRTITKKARLFLAHELHERYHRGVKEYHIILKPI